MRKIITVLTTVLLMVVLAGCSGDAVSRAQGAEKGEVKYAQTPSGLKEVTYLDGQVIETKDVPTLEEAAREMANAIFVSDAEMFSMNTAHLTARAVSELQALGFKIIDNGIGRNAKGEDQYAHFYARTVNIGQKPTTAIFWPLGNGAPAVVMIDAGSCENGYGMHFNLTRNDVRSGTGTSDKLTKQDVKEFCKMAEQVSKLALQE